MSERRKWPCLRCGIDVTEYRGMCMDCRSFVVRHQEEHMWNEPKAYRRERMKFFAQVGVVPNPIRTEQKRQQRARKNNGGEGCVPESLHGV